MIQLKEAALEGVCNDMHPRLAQVASTSSSTVQCREESFDCSRQRRPSNKQKQGVSFRDRKSVPAASRDGAQVRAIAIPWNDGADQLEPTGRSPWGGWSFEDVEQSDELAERPQAQTSSRDKSLKINRDLLLVSLSIFCPGSLKVLWQLWAQEAFFRIDLDCLVSFSAVPIKSGEAGRVPSTDPA